ncbi:MAG TPA: hypothetical protein VI795_00005, partial [Patescibacteria group bacterium]|nr:hypothetical protein [Patescibacteria group bacterium]
MLKDAISNVTLIGVNSRSIVVCNSCHTIVAEDRGRPEDLPQIVSRVKSHVGVPNMLLEKKYRHEILTVDVNNATSTDGLCLEKNYSD